jgi:exodeoxyribonuclease III
MNIVSWNVNGLRACYAKGFAGFFRSVNADIFCVQETKLQQGEIELDIPGYLEYWNYAQRKGYSGTAVFSRTEPLSVSYGLGIPAHDTEGRVITLEFDEFCFVNVYVPNSGEELKRLSYRMEWDDDFREYLKALDEKKPVVVCGDFNVAHRDIDLKNPSSNHHTAGFTDDEREKFSKLLDSGFVDAFRYLYPDAKDQYTYWTYMFHARARNAGWRIDYGCISERIRAHLRGFKMHSGVTGSDHCPVEMEIF